jgi:uncharacterized protein (TIGR02284 family)
MRTRQDDDHALAMLEAAAERVHTSSFVQGEVDKHERTRISTALNECIEGVLDVERFLAHAAADARDPDLHLWLYDAAREVAAFPVGLERALASVGAFVERSGTARGALRRAALEASVALRGRTDALVLRQTENAVVRTVAKYDDALARLATCTPGFVLVVVDQRKDLARIHREIVDWRKRLRG